MRLLSGLAIGAGIIMALGTFCGLAEAEQSHRQAPHEAALPRATAIAVGQATSTPYGWVDFCQRYEAECETGVRRARDLVLTPRTLANLRRVNALVNRMIRPMSDMDHWGVVDQWDIPTDGYGDCEDYALLKRKLLIEEGVPRQALLMTVVKDENAEGHAVLTVMTDRGEFVLDNMHDSVVAWEDLPYRFVKRQSQEDENLWVQIGEPTAAPLTVSR